MQEALSPQEPHFLYSCVRDRYNADLARSPLDPRHHRPGGKEHARRASYPSPPMSGPSPPPPSYRPSLSAAVNISSTSSTTSEQTPGSQQPEFRTTPHSPQGSAHGHSHGPESHQPPARPITNPLAPPYEYPSSHTVYEQASRPRDSQSATASSAGEHQFSEATSDLQSPVQSSRTVRRTKAHTPSACVNCKRAHLRCEAQRPCPRCIKFNKQSTCQDVRHKKRGRPRIREQREGMQPPNPGYSKSQAALQSPVVSPAVSTRTAHFAITSGIEHSEVNSSRKRDSIGSASLSNSPKRPYIPDMGTEILNSIPSVEPIDRGPAVAYLTMDLILIKASFSFREATGLGLDDLNNLPLLNVLSPASHAKVSEIRRQMDMERYEHAKTLPALPYVLESDVRQSIKDVLSSEYLNVTRPFMDRLTEELTFRTPKGQYRTCQIQAKLAKASSYFVALFLPFSTQSTNTSQLQPSPYSLSALPPLSRSSLASSPVFLSKYQPIQIPPSTRSSAPSSPYYSTLGPGLTSPATHSRPSTRASIHDISYLPHTGSYPNSSVSSPVSQLPRPAPSLPSPSSLPPRRDSSYSSSSQRPESMGDLQLPPIRGEPLASAHAAPFPPPASSPSAGKPKRRATDEEEEKKGDGSSWRRKRARIDVKEVMD